MNPFRLSALDRKLMASRIVARVLLLAAVLLAGCQPWSRNQCLQRFDEMCRADLGAARDVTAFRLEACEESLEARVLAWCLETVVVQGPDSGDKEM